MSIWVILLIIILLGGVGALMLLIGRVNTCECDLRERALEMAIEWRGQNEGSPERLIEVAQKFYDFLKGNEDVSEC